MNNIKNRDKYVGKLMEYKRLNLYIPQGLVVPRKIIKIIRKWLPKEIPIKIIHGEYYGVLSLGFEFGSKEDALIIHYSLNAACRKPTFFEVITGHDKRTVY